jgi:hypothetical protein
MSPRLVAFYWLSFFLFVSLWGLGCIIVRASRRGEGRWLKRVQLAGACYGTVAIVAAPWIVGIAGYVPVVFLVEGVPRVFFTPSSRHFLQLRNTLSGFALTSLMGVFGLLTGQGMWWIGGAILLAASIWNLYSEYALKPVMQEFYSDLDEVTLWSGPMLPEEAPVLVMPLAALLFFPWPLGNVPAAAVAGITSLLPFALLVPPLLTAAVLIAVFLPADLKRVAAVRALLGLTLLFLLALIVASVARQMEVPVIRFSLDGLAGPQGALDSTRTGRELVALCLWSMVAAFLLGVIPMMVALVHVFARRPEYDLFISFATANRMLADRMAGLARQHGLRYFFSDESILTGDQFAQQLQKAIRNSLEMAVLYTPESARREWVRHEWTTALALSKRVTPILHECTVQDLPEPLRGYQSAEYYDVQRFLQEVAQRSHRRMRHAQER